VKEIARRWYPEVPAFKKGDQHLALADILDSVKELRYYREKIFAASAAGAPPTSEPGPA
jgi:oligoribonuclease